MKNRIKKQKCFHHDDNRDISEYVFWHTDIRKKNHVDIYECKKCKERLEKALDRERRIDEHNKQQEHEAYLRYEKKSNKRNAKRQMSIQEDIWDFVVRDELAKGIKLKGKLKWQYKEQIPKEILQFTRAVMKLQRLIGLKKKQIIDENRKIIEAIKKSQQPLIHCERHGNLYLKDVIKGGKSRWTNEQKYKCRACMSDLHRDYYERRKEYVRKKQAEYRAKYPERVKEIKAKSWRKNNDKDTVNEAVT